MVKASPVLTTLLPTVHFAVPFLRNEICVASVAPPAVVSKLSCEMAFVVTIVIGVLVVALALIVVAAIVLGVVAPSVPFSAPPVMVGLVSVLFVSVSVVALPTSVSVASGSERVLSTVCVLLNIVRVFVVPPAALNMMRFVASTESCTLT